MRLQHFRMMVDQMAAEIPEEYLDGIAAVEVSRKTIPHPVRAHVFTMGECVPIDVGPDLITSRVVLYHGSFQALAAEQQDFDWREEAWETLMHELRHHLEWRAGSPELERYDWAAEHNFARQEGQPFDPMFYRAGERIEDGVYRVDDDVFLERIVSRLPEAAEFIWHGARYRVTVPPVTLPLYLVLDSLQHPPPGEAVIVFRRKPRWWHLFTAATEPAREVVVPQPIAGM